MPVIEPKQEKSKELASQDRLDEKLMKAGKYEITQEDVFTIEIWLKRVEKRWILCNANEKNSTKEEVAFRMWTYDEMINLRKMATSYDPIKRLHMVDHDALNRLKIQKFLLTWTFDRDNPRLRIHHSGGVMTDESWGAFTKLHPNICTFIIERMNMVFEYNG
jgi:hypothetical protein